MDETEKLSQIYDKLNNDQTKPTDLTHHDIFAVATDKNERERLRIVQLDPEGGEMTFLGQIPYLCQPYGVVSCGGFIFCLGDWNRNGLVREFDLVKRTSRTPTRLAEPVWLLASAASSHEIIVAGGENGRYESVATCCVYAPATNRWTSLRPLRQARQDHKICWLPDGRVFAIGGFGRNYPGYYLSSVEMLEHAWIPVPREEASADWQTVAPMKASRRSFGCCSVDGRIVVAGGWTGGSNPSSSVDSFEPPTTTNIGQWTSLTDLPFALTFCFIVPSADELVLIDMQDGKIQIGKRKAQVASSHWDPWTWEPRPKRPSFSQCFGLVSLPSAPSSSLCWATGADGLGKKTSNKELVWKQNN